MKKTDFMSDFFKVGVNCLVGDCGSVLYYCSPLVGDTDGRIAA